MALLNAMLLLSIPATAFAETPVVGGWSLPNMLSIPEEAKILYDQTADEMDEELEPMALLGTQVVAGTNYCFLCKDGDARYVLVYIRQKPEGGAELLEKSDLYIGLKEDVTGETETEPFDKIVSDPHSVNADPITYSSIIAPSDDYVIERLKKIDTVTKVAAVTEEHDPNGQLHKPGGYIGCIYFEDSLVDKSKVYREGDVIDIGTEGGGAIEIFDSVDDANKRNSYLSTFDGGILSNGSHTVVGTCVVRISDHLTATQQRELTDTIIDMLGGEMPVISSSGIEAVSSVPVEVNEDSSIELYNQDGYIISCLGFDTNIIGNYVLRLRIQNLTHRNIEIADMGSYINGSMVTVNAYFSIAAGKTQTVEAMINPVELADAGIDKVEDVTLNLNVTDSESYEKIAYIGPLTISITDRGSIENKKVYYDKETIKEVQLLLNAAGYDCGVADGVAGKKTNSMILQYEKDNGLKENTDITDELLVSLRGNSD